MNAGDVLTATGCHPRIVCSFPDPTDGRVLLVTLTDIKNETDHSCTFAAGEHPAITKDCAVKYRLSYFQDDAELERAVKAGVARKREPMTQNQFQRVLHGLEISKAVKPAIREALRTAGLLPRERPPTPL